MDNYVISDEEQIIDAQPPFPSQYVEGTKVMDIKKNTKLMNIVDYVRKEFENDSVRHIIFQGIGDAADKCISCVEIFKRKYNDPVYQWTALQTAKRITFWDPLIEEMDRIKVTVDTPALFILVSRDPYPVEHQCLSMQVSKELKTSTSAAGDSVSRPRPGRGRQKPNNWSRPSKDQRQAQGKERDEVVNSIKAE